MQHLEKRITKDLLFWYDHNARILPWRSEPTPYRVWISEIMLQQTRVEAVKPYYDRFMEKLDSVEALANVEDEELLKLWEGLGYYNRARNLKVAANEIMNEYHGQLPPVYEELLKLKGIGEYTAGAIGSIAYGLLVPAVDGNVLRVVARMLANKDDVLKASTKKWMTEEIKNILPKDRPGDFNQALMELGATVCIPNGKPLCEKCPWDTVCMANKTQTQMDYPVKTKKKKRKIEKKTILLLESEGKYAIRKRKEKGLLANMWEFPWQEGKLTYKQIENYLCESQIEAYEVDKKQDGKHIFSHIEWHMCAYYIKLKKKPADSAYIWASKQEIKEKYAIPSAFELYKNEI